MRISNQALRKRAEIAIKDLQKQRALNAKMQSTYEKKMVKMQQAFQKTEVLNKASVK